MAQICKVCRHPQLDSINRAILSGDAHLAIAKRYGLNHTNIGNHAAKHLPKRLATNYEKRQQGELDELREGIAGLLQKVDYIMERNIEKGTQSADLIALRAICEKTRVYQLLSTTATELYKLKLLEFEVMQEKHQREDDVKTSKFWHEHTDYLSKEEQGVLLSILSKAIDKDTYQDALKDIRPAPAEELPVKRKPGRPRKRREEEEPDVNINDGNIQKPEQETESEQDALNRLNLQKEDDTPARSRNTIASVETDDDATKARVKRELRNIPPGGGRPV